MPQATVRGPLFTKLVNDLGTPTLTALAFTVHLISFAMALLVSFLFDPTLIKLAQLIFIDFPSQV